MLSPLHERCNWVSPNICIGAKPLQNFHWFLKAPNYDQKNWLVVSLVECDLFLPVSSELTTSVERISYPIENDGNSKSKSGPIETLIKEIEVYLEKDYYIYIHCQGGIGRSNMISAILIGRKNGWDTPKTLKWLEKCRLARPYKGRDFVPILEYPQQEALVQKFLGGDSYLYGVDKVDRKWCSKLKAARKTELVVTLAGGSLHSEVKFFGPGTYKAFSNFYESPIKINGKVYSTTEHYFQAKKFDYPGASPRSKEYAEIIRKAKTPGMAKMMASQKPSYRFPWMRPLSETIKSYQDVKLRLDWEQVKEGVMMTALYQKFVGCEGVKPKPLMKLLMDTGYSVIKEDSPYDSYWGVGKDGKGLNRLGVCLMYLRSMIRDAVFQSR